MSIVSWALVFIPCGTMAAPLQVAGVEQFMVGPDISDAAIRWPEWQDDFVTFIAASGVTAATQKHALLKHCAGIRPPETFEASAGHWD